MSVGDAPDGSSHRSWVKIKWDSGGTNDYRRAHDGLLDVKCTTPANGELYYPDHLSKLGKSSPHYAILKLEHYTVTHAGSSQCVRRVISVIVCLFVCVYVLTLKTT